MNLGHVIYCETKGLRYYSVKGSDDHKKVIVECVGVGMGLQIPLLIIDPRGVSIISALFTNRRVTHLRDTDIQFGAKVSCRKE